MISNGKNYSVDAADTRPWLFRFLDWLFPERAVVESKLPVWAADVVYIKTVCTFSWPARLKILLTGSARISVQCATSIVQDKVEGDVQVIAGGL